MGGDFDELYLLSKCGFKYWFCTYLMHCEVINVSFVNVKEILSLVLLYWNYFVITYSNLYYCNI